MVTQNARFNESSPVELSFERRRALTRRIEPVAAENRAVALDVDDPFGRNRHQDGAIAVAAIETTADCVIARDHVAMRMAEAIAVADGKDGRLRMHALDERIGR